MAQMGAEVVVMQSLHLFIETKVIPDHSKHAVST